MYNRYYAAGDEFSEYSLDYPVGDSPMRFVKYAKDLKKVLKKLYSGENFSIFCRGSSGALIAGALVGVGLPVHKIIHVKKLGESSHSGNANPGIKSSDKILIVDDFIASGETVKAIYDYIREKYEDREVEALCIAGYLPDGTIENPENVIAKVNTIICRELGDHNEKENKINLREYKEIYSEESISIDF